MDGARHVSGASERIELRRGILTLAVLSRLREPHYGYSLRQALSEHGLAVEEGTLYPLLRRCEQRGLLASEWVTEAGRERRYYRLTDEGRKVFEELAAEWAALSSSVSGLIEARS